MEERRLRYVHTCLVNTRYEIYKKKFDKFGQTLYEERWHEVLQFLEKINPLLQTLILTFDVQKYLSGVDYDASRDTQAAAEERQDARKGFVKFSPYMLKESLSSGLFLTYHAAMLATERIPNRLAQEGEMCPCHKFLMKSLHLSLYKRELLTEKHYGVPGPCPMAGKNLPELCGGYLEEALEEEAELQEQRLRGVSYRGAPQPTPADWSIVTEDFNAQKLHILMELRQKPCSFSHSQHSSLCWHTFKKEGLARGRQNCSSVQLGSTERGTPPHHVETHAAWHNLCCGIAIVHPGNSPKRLAYGRSHANCNLALPIDSGNDN